MKKLLLFLIAALFAATSTWAQTSYVSFFGGPSGWYSDDTRNTSGTVLNGLEYSYPPYFANIPGTDADDQAIAQQIKFGNFYAGSTNGVMQLDGTTSNLGKSSVKYFMSTGIPATPYLANFTSTFRWYMEPYTTTRTVALSLMIIGSDNNIYSMPFVGEGAVPNSWNTFAVDANTTPLVPASYGWFLYGLGAPGGAGGGKSLNAWLADPTWGPILSGGTIVAQGFNIGSYQRYCRVGIDWLQSSILNNGNLIDFVSPTPTTDIVATATTTCGNYNFQVKVKDFINVGAISLLLNYDVAKLDYLNFTQNPAFTNDLELNEQTQGQLYISYFSSSGITLADNDVLLTLNFSLLPSASGITSNLTWSTDEGDCEYAGPAGVPVYSSTFNNYAWTIPVRPVKNTNTNLEYCTIQAAINDPATNDAVGDHDVITVAAGIYPENVTINKSLDIRGPNYGIAGNSSSRILAEAIIVPGTSSVGGEILMVKTSNVSINGFMIDGDNVALTSGWIGTNGADINAAEGVTIYDAIPVVNNLVVSNNIVQNLGYFGVTLFGASNYSDANTSKTGHVIENNLFRDLGYYGTGNGYDSWGGGVLLYNSHYAHVVGNVMTNVRIGIQTGNFQTAHIGDPQFQVIENNMIQTRYSGIFFNLHNYSPFTVSNNIITGLDNATQASITTRPWRGMLIASLGNNMGSSTFSNNTIDGSGITLFTTGKEGINVWNVQNSSAASIIGGSISGVTTGIFLNNFEGYSSDAGYGAHASINGVSISASEIGVRLLDSPSSTTNANVNATVTNCYITGGTDGVKLEETASGIVTGTVNENSITGNSGYAINATTITNTMAGTCNWYGTNTVAGVAAEINGPVTYIPWLADGSDIGNPGFVPGGSCTGATDLYVNDGTYDGNDIYTSAIGNDANLYGTAAAPFLTITKAVNTAVDGTNIWVDAGTFQEQLSIGKTVNITGVDTTLTIIKAPVQASMVPVTYATGFEPNSYAIVFAYGNGKTVNISKVTVDGDDGRSLDGYKGVYYYEASGTFTANKIINIHDYPVFNGNQRGRAFYGYCASPSVQSLTISNNNIYNYQKGGIYVRGNGSTATVTGNKVRGHNTPGVTADNGIVFMIGAAGSVTSNNVAYNIYGVHTLPRPVGGWDESSGILLYSSGLVNVSGNTLTGNEAALVTYDYDDLTIGANTFVNNKTHLWVDVTGQINGSNSYDKTVLNPDQPLVVYGCIQYGIDWADANDILNASAGTFAELVYVHTSVSLNGPNASINPNVAIPPRVAEAIITFPTGLAGYQDLVTIGPWDSRADVDNVIIQGFTLDGSTHITTSGTTGIMGNGGNGTVIQNNIIKNFSYVTLWISSYVYEGGVWVYDDYNVNATIQGNYINNGDIFSGFVNADIVYGIYLQGTYGTISGNVVEDTKTAIQIQPYNHPNGSSLTGTVSGNTFEGYREPIWFNYSENANASWSFDNNNCKGIISPAGVSIVDWHGIRITGFDLSEAGFTNNTINPYASTATNTYGIGFKDISDNFSLATISGNFISGADYGIYIPTGLSVAGNIIIEENSITSNLLYGLYNGTTTSVYANCNWWGTADGDLIAPMISGNVSYVQWLVNGFDNSGDPGFQPVPGSCSGAPDLTGTYKYYNSGLTPLNAVTVQLYKDGSPFGSSVTTDVFGNYTFTNVLPDTYEVRAETSEAVGGINSTDAAQVNYWAINPSYIEMVRYYSGDVVMDNKVMPGDAGRIQGYFLTQGSVGWVNRPAWTFWNTGDLINANLDENLLPVYPTVTLSAVGTTATRNFYGLVTGDFNRSFTLGAKSSSESLTLNYGQTVEVGEDAFELPLVAAKDMQVGAISLILNFPSDVITVNEVYLSNDQNTPVLFDVTGNELRISWYSPEPVSLQAGQRLVTLVLEATGSSGEPIYFSLASDPLNELADDSFEVISDAVLTVDVIKTSALGTGGISLSEKLSFSNHPNPFIGTTNFVYTIPADGKVLLEVYDIVGNKVMVAVDETQSTGEYLLKVDRNTLQPGVYMATLRLESAGTVMSQTIKIISK